ncbi:twin-arginine translocation pathway signal [Mycobacterium asiaticum]|uniref:Twin-arginine translocation pathway signal n=1 Tax=Mycobacterium asiaticum TaxID=1790 RepID=A0A1A3NLK2_MYCAS|nr:twin-arginine translocation pathway signal [Mycobacterium asiaticum]OBK21929.1 twin-arginine translocation pathway signal [Mycobacterium asiaticum]
MKRSLPRRWLARWRPILLTVLVVGTTAFAAGYFQLVYRTDMETDRAVTRQVISAASDGAVALLSYSPATLSRDLANAKSRVTENYLPYYQQFADQIVGPSTQRAQVTTTATVVRAAVSELHPNSAVVLVFVKQKTASKEKPEPVVTSNSLRVTLKKVNGSWLIEKFDSA